MKKIATIIYGAHRVRPPGTPVLKNVNVKDLKQALDDIQNSSRNSEGFYPVTYQISDEVDLLAEPWFLQNWSVSYPALGLPSDE